MKTVIFLLFLLQFFIVPAQNSISDSDMDSLDQLISDLVESSKKEQKPEKKQEKPAAKPQKTEKKQEGKQKKTDGKKLVVIDPGHGGKDPGTVSGKLYEKDIVLKLAKKIEKLSRNYKNIIDNFL